MHWATRALASLEPPDVSAAPTLVARLKSPNTYTRDWAALGLGKMGVKAAAYLPDLRQARQHEPDPQNRATMDAAIAKIAGQ